VGGLVEEVADISTGMGSVSGCAVGSRPETKDPRLPEPRSGDSKTSLALGVDSILDASLLELRFLALFSDPP